jgi:fumarate reductase flavoprotein subunit
MTQKIDDIFPSGEGNFELPDIPPEDIFGKQEVISEPRYSFEIPPAPVPEKDIKITITSDIAVIGGGIAGSCAALSAAEAGAQTILIEKTDRYQGHGLMYGVIGSRLQKKLGIEIDKDEVILKLMQLAGNRPDQRLLRMWADNSGIAMDWLMDITDKAELGVFILDYPPPARFNNANEYYPQYLATHHYVLGLGPEEGRVTKCIMDNAAKKGVVTYFNTQARQLIRAGGKARVTGLIAQDKDGNYIKFLVRKAVILCTGDYGNNREMVTKYCPHVLNMKCGLKTSTGEGLQMAMWSGAVMEPGPHTPMMHASPNPLGGVAFLNVNLKGERFQNEDIPGYAYINAIARQPGKTAWQIFDTKYPEELPLMGIGLGKRNMVTETKLDFPTMQHSIERQTVEKQAVKANTVEELAEKIKVPVATLKATVERYNYLVKLGKDLDFGKRPDRLTPIDHPPYYAGKDWGVKMYHVLLGGLNTNTRLQAVDKDWEAIPGLYLAGNTMGNRFAVDYPTMVPGISHGMCITFGRIAGKNAATLEP